MAREQERSISQQELQAQAQTQASLSETLTLLLQQHAAGTIPAESLVASLRLTLTVLNNGADLLTAVSTQAKSGKDPSIQARRQEELEEKQHQRNLRAVEAGELDIFEDGQLIPHLNMISGIPPIRGTRRRS